MRWIRLVMGLCMVFLLVACERPDKAEYTVDDVRTLGTTYRERLRPVMMSMDFSSYEPLLEGMHTRASIEALQETNASVRPFDLTMPFEEALGIWERFVLYANDVEDLDDLTIASGTTNGVVWTIRFAMSDTSLTVEVRMQEAEPLDEEDVLTTWEILTIQDVDDVLEVEYLRHVGYWTSTGWTPLVIRGRLDESGGVLRFEQGQDEADVENLTLYEPDTGFFYHHDKNEAESSYVLDDFEEGYRVVATLYPDDSKGTSQLRLYDEGHLVLIDDHYYGEIFTRHTFALSLLACTGWDGMEILPSGAMTLYDGQTIVPIGDWSFMDHLGVPMIDTTYDDPDDLIGIRSTLEGLTCEMAPPSFIQGRLDVLSMEYFAQILDDHGVSDRLGDWTLVFSDWE